MTGTGKVTDPAFVYCVRSLALRGAVGIFISGARTGVFGTGPMTAAGAVTGVLERAGSLERTGGEEDALATLITSSSSDP